MKRYVKQTTNTVHYIADIRREFPNVSIPNDADCSSFGYEFLIETPAPVQEGFNAVEIAPVNNKQTWELKAIETTIPQSITPLQAKLQLLEIGLLDEVETLIVKDRKAELYWNGASQFLIDDEILLNMAAVIGLSQEQLNNLFLQASKL